jgi:(p)ppGpp synthase/HD superfamily hydrolase
MINQQFSKIIIVIFVINQNMEGTMKEAVDQIEQILTGRQPLSNKKRQYQQDMAANLRAWQAPEAVREAARLLPWCSDPPLLEKLCESLPSPIRRLIMAWYELRQMTLVPTAGARHSEDTRSLKLRCLMRAAYLNFPVVVLTVAEHAAQMSAELETTRQPSFWEDTETIFLPLLRMLGMWELRRQWVERTAEHRYPTEYKEIKAKIEMGYDGQKKWRDKIAEHLHKWSNGVIPFEVELHDIAPGRVVYHHLQGEALEELQRTLVITIYTDNAGDCYRLLEPAHQIGMPVQGRLSDHIAHPHSNGYRGLHTTVRLDPQLRNSRIERLRFGSFPMK